MWNVTQVRANRRMAIAMQYKTFVRVEMSRKVYQTGKIGIDTYSSLHFRTGFERDQYNTFVSYSHADTTYP